MKMKHVKGVVNDPYDKNLQAFKRDRDAAKALQAAMLAHRDAQYGRSGLFKETVVFEDGDTIIRLRT